MPRRFPPHVPLAAAGIVILLLVVTAPGGRAAGRAGSAVNQFHRSDREPSGWPQRALLPQLAAEEAELLAAVPPPPAPAEPIPPPPLPYGLRPVDNSVPVYIPYPAGRVAPVPNVLPGYSERLILTFDDCGSAEQMEGIVTALGQVHRQGLFFITGQCRDHYPWLVDTLKEAGHQVCNHTYSHPDLRRLSDRAIRAEIGAGVFASCPYFRPPFGAWDGPRGRIARIAGEFGLVPLLWDVDSRDWAGASAESIAAAARARGGVILFHLHGWTTAEAVRQLPG